VWAGFVKKLLALHMRAFNWLEHVPFPTLSSAGRGIQVLHINELLILQQSMQASSPYQLTFEKIPPAEIGGKLVPYLFLIPWLSDRLLEYMFDK
jgi:hypothetical protein